MEIDVNFGSINIVFLKKSKIPFITFIVKKFILNMKKNYMNIKNIKININDLYSYIYDTEFKNSEPFIISIDKLNKNYENIKFDSNFEIIVDIDKSSNKHINININKYMISIFTPLIFKLKEFTRMIYEMSINSVLFDNYPKFYSNMFINLYLNSCLYNIPTHYNINSLMILFIPILSFKYEKIYQKANEVINKIKLIKINKLNIENIELEDIIKKYLKDESDYFIINNMIVDLKIIDIYNVEKNNLIDFFLKIILNKKLENNKNVNYNKLNKDNIFLYYNMNYIQILSVFKTYMISNGLLNISFVDLDIKLYELFLLTKVSEFFQNFKLNDIFFSKEYENYLNKIIKTDKKLYKITENSKENLKSLIINIDGIKINLLDDIFNSNKYFWKFEIDKINFENYELENISGLSKFPLTIHLIFFNSFNNIWEPIWENFTLNLFKINKIEDNNLQSEFHINLFNLNTNINLSVEFINKIKTIKDYLDILNNYYKDSNNIIKINQYNSYNNPIYVFIYNNTGYNIILNCIYDHKKILVEIKNKENHIIYYLKVIDENNKIIEYMKPNKVLFYFNLKNSKKELLNLSYNPLKFKYSFNDNKYNSSYDLNGNNNSDFPFFHFNNLESFGFEEKLEKNLKNKNILIKIKNKFMEKKLFLNSHIKIKNSTNLILILFLNDIENYSIHPHNYENIHSLSYNNFFNIEMKGVKSDPVDLKKILNDNFKIMEFNLNLKNLYSIRIVIKKKKLITINLKPSLIIYNKTLINLNFYFFSRILLKIHNDNIIYVNNNEEGVETFMNLDNFYNKLSSENNKFKTKSKAININLIPINSKINSFEKGIWFFEENESNKKFKIYLNYYNFKNQLYLIAYHKSLVFDDLFINSQFTQILKTKEEFLFKFKECENKRNIYYSKNDNEIYISNGRNQQTEIKTNNIGEYFTQIIDKSINHNFYSFNISISISFKNNNLNSNVYTKIINIKPQFIFINLSKFNFYFKKSNEFSKFGNLTLKTNEKVPLINICEEDFFNLRLDNTHWSDNLEVNNIGFYMFSLKENNNDLLHFVYEVNYINSSFYLSVYDNIKDNAPILLINELEIYNISVSQKKETLISNFNKLLINSNSKKFYSWENPFLNNLKLYIKFENKNLQKISNKLMKIYPKDENIDEIQIDDNKIYCIKENKNNYISIKFTLFKNNQHLNSLNVNYNKIILEAKNFGISIIGGNNYNRKEFTYINLKDLRIVKFENDEKLNFNLNIKSLNINNNAKYETLYPLIWCPYYDYKTLFDKNMDLINIFISKNKTNNNSLFIDEFYFEILKTFLKIEELVLDNFVQIFNQFKKNDNYIYKFWKNKFWIINEKKIISDYFNTNTWMEEEKSNMNKIYFKNFKISNLPFIISFKKNIENTKDDPLIIYKNLFNALGFIISNIDDFPLELKEIILRKELFPLSILKNKIINHYKKFIFKLIINLIGSINLFGNPVGLFKEIKQGINDFINIPKEEYKKNNDLISFSKGLLSGTNSLFKHIISGAFLSINRLTKSLSEGISTLSLDQKYLIERDRLRYKNHNSFIIGVKQLGLGMKEGLIGILDKPIEGINNDGFIGGIKGGIQGLAGIIIKPVAGILDFTAGTADLLKNNINDKDLKYPLERIRNIRYFSTNLKFYEVYNELKSDIIKANLNQKHKILLIEFVNEDIIYNPLNGNKFILNFDNSPNFEYIIICNDKIWIFYKNSFKIFSTNEIKNIKKKNNKLIFYLIPNLTNNTKNEEELIGLTEISLIKIIYLIKVLLKNQYIIK